MLWLHYSYSDLAILTFNYHCMSINNDSRSNFFSYSSFFSLFLNLEKFNNDGGINNPMKMKAGNAVVPKTHLQSIHSSIICHDRSLSSLKAESKNYTTHVLSYQLLLTKLMSYQIFLATKLISTRAANQSVSKKTC